MSVVPLLQRLAGTSVARRAADTLFGHYARHRVAGLDRRSVARVQHATLRRLVQHGRHTDFGRQHDFAGIRNVRDYQARVPLREYEAFWKQYWQPGFPRLDGVTWPGAIPYLALSSGTTTGTTKYVPVSRQMLASNRRAALTTLSLFLAAHPGTPLFAGRIFFLGGSTDLRELKTGAGETRIEDREWRTEKHRGQRLDSRSSVLDPRSSILAGDLSGIATRELSPVLRPYTFPPLELALENDWQCKVQVLAERSARLPITVLSGVPAWLLVLFDRLKRLTGRDRVADLWPMLRLVVHGGTKFDPYRSLFRREIGSERVRFLETYPSSEGFVATEDPRHDLLRLIPDHGIFFEFVPVGELGCDRPTRHTAVEVVPGVQYAVVLTTCAGLWAYVLGDTVCFEKRDPPLLRFTGRTRYYLSAFGEHLISEEIERAVAQAADATDAALADFHVGPVFPERPGVAGRHRYLVEFVRAPRDVAAFAAALDAALCALNDDYKAHRGGDLGLAGPEVWVVPPHGFADWLRSRGQLGGQHKLPRMDNSGRLTEELCRWLRLQPGQAVLPHDTVRAYNEGRNTKPPGPGETWTTAPLPTG